LLDLALTFIIITTPVTEFAFVGNESITAKTLSRELISQKDEEYNPVNIDFDIERIVRSYKTQGFFETTVAVAVDSIEDGLRLTFTVTEGHRPCIRDIIVNGAHKNKLADYFEIQPGDFFIDSKIKKTEDNITDHYKNRGFAYVDVRSTSLPDSGVLLFNVDRGKQYYIRNIIIEGLKKCKPEVIKREIELKHGDMYNKTKLTRSQRRIYSLGFFSTINVELIKQQPDSVDLVFRIRELKSRILNFGFGFSTPSNVLVSLGFEELNFFNMGHRFLVRPTFEVNIEGEYELKLEGRYTIPYVPPWTLTLSFLPFLWYEKNTALTKQTRGIESRLSKLFTENIQFNASNQYKYVDLRLEPGESLSDTLRGVTNSIKLQVMIDYRDEFFNPKKGFYTLPFIEWAGSIFKGDNHFVRMEADARYYIPISIHTIAQRIRLGVLIPTNGCEIYEKYSLGGQYSVRGYPEKSIGPDSISVEDYTEKYGNIVGNYNCEARITLPWNFGIISFFDVGYVDNIVDLGRSDFFKASFGFGLRYYSPIGPARFDIGFPLTNPELGPGIYLGIYHIF
jgi:outer membrane protein insertion porin family